MIIEEFGTKRNQDRKVAQQSELLNKGFNF